MSNLIYYTPGRFESMSHLPDMKVFLALFKVFNNNISFIDRTGLIVPPVKTETLPPLQIPNADSTFNMSFDDCAIDSAQRIYKKHLELQIPIRIGWSGGIDSSATLMAFIEALGMAEATRCVEIAMTNEGLIENPYLWEKIIQPNNFKILNSMLVTNDWQDSSIMVNGEGGDQLHGTDIFRWIVSKYGKAGLSTPWTEEHIVGYIKLNATSLTDQEALLLANILIKMVSNAPVEITTTGDFWWWINFTAKWASTFYRLTTKAPENVITQEFIDNHFFPFYNTKNFQLWSMHKRNEAYKGTWESYKWKAKEFVARTSNSPEYNMKHRQGSLYNILAHTTRAEGIDSNFKFYDRLDPEEWYEPNNSFKI